MNTLRFDDSRQLELNAAEGDVAISEWDQDSIELTIDGELEQCAALQHQNTLTVSCRAAIAVRVPAQTPVHVRTVTGDLLLRRLGGVVTVDEAQGDVSAREIVAPVTLCRVHGSLVADHLRGPLKVGEVQQDSRLVDLLSAHLDRAHGQDQVGRLQ